MLKKHFLFTLLSFAFGIMLAHNIVPHHHHDTEKELTEHHKTNHQHDNNEAGDLSHLFSHFVHPDNGVTFTANHNYSSIFSRQISLTAVLLEIFCFDRVDIPLLLYSPPEQTFTYVPPHSLASGLRAPPSC